LGLCLDKKSRSNTAGEDWSEKIAAELCESIKLPHAEYELATCNGDDGIISRSVLPEYGNLILGNEILARIHPDYPKDTRDLSQHTLDRIFGAFDRLEAKYSEVSLPLGWEPIDNIIKVQHTFIGYLLLDAWIGNSDRHHENWGFVELDQKLYLAPTYDHASSLGRNESDQKRDARLKTQDRGYSVGAYTDKCQSYLYTNIGNRQRIKTFEAFCEAAKFYPQAACIWLDRLGNISADNTLRLFKRVPENRRSTIHLFPLFSNRLMTRSRPDYSRYIQSLNISVGEDDPMTVLARSGGGKATDSYEVFPCPEIDENGIYHTYFFVRGLQYLPKCSLDRAAQLQPQEYLYLSHDLQNLYDPKALLLHTKDRDNLGYCPRYLSHDIFPMLQENPRLVKVEIDRVNPPPTPMQFRLLCRMTVECDPLTATGRDFKPFAGEDYQPLSDKRSRMGIDCA